MISRFHFLGLIALLYASVHMAFDIVPLLGYLSITHKFKPTSYVDVALWFVLLSGSITLLSGKQWGKWLILFSLSTAAILDIINIIHKNPFHTNMPLVLNILLVIFFVFILWRRTTIASDNESDTEKSKFDMIYGSYALLLIILLVIMFSNNLFGNMKINGLKISDIPGLFFVWGYSLHIAAFMSIILSCAMFARYQWHLIIFSLFIAILLIVLDYCIFIMQLDSNIFAKLTIVVILLSLFYVAILVTVLIQWFFFERKHFKLYTERQIKWDYSMSKKYWFDLAYLSFSSLPVLLAIIVLLQEFTNLEKIKIIPDVSLFDIVLIVLSIIAMFIVIAGIIISFRERSKKLKTLAILVIPWVIISIGYEIFASYDGINKTMLDALLVFEGAFALVFYLLFVVFATQWFFFERQKINETS